MYTSVIKKRSSQALKTVVVYSFITLFCVIFDKVYALFGHGVVSPAMYLMYLYPLIGGVLAFLMVWLFVPGAESVRHRRFLYNCYHSGIATLTVASALSGVFEIAGTSSMYMTYYYIGGGVMAGVALVGYLFSLGSRKA